MINIYRASAGAGKTHTLTGEYIKLLFNQPYAYKHILAVTFTNKATDEMKQRILQELYHLSVPGKKSDYLGELMELYKRGEPWVRGEARRILVAILHDYSSFSISTIDKFFQTVMRSFARELGKIATYNVELDRDGVVSNAIDRMFSDLDKPENDNLLKWLIEYSLDAVDAGDSWNIRKEIFNLAKELFSEDFKLKKRGGADENCVERGEIVVLKNSVRKIIERFEQTAQELGGKGMECMRKAGLSPADFKGGSRSPFKYFQTLASPSAGKKVEPPKGSFTVLYNQLDGWYSGKSAPAPIVQVYGEGLNDCIGEVIACFERGYRVYATAGIILGNINALGILDDIYRRVLAYCREKNIMLLSESTELLNRIIDGSDTPFVYEKIGTRIDHFMLDEFQDTSTLQWRNFYPLLQNSLAMGNENLIVGDVKQSIYRWRGSDWKILNNKLFEDFRADEIVCRSLDCNWRSGKNIVAFNNLFFRFCALAAQRVYDENGGDTEREGLIDKIYSDFEQQVPQKGKEHPGYVEVNFVTESDAGFAADVLSVLPERVRDLVDSGIRQKDIAVLVRKREQGRDVAQTLIAAGFDVISNDSLFVSSSGAVQKVVNILREIENPDNPALKIYRCFSAMENGPAVDTATGKVYDEDLFCAEETELPLENLSGRSLYQMCEEIIRCYLTPGEKEDLAFLQSFLDSVLEYTNKEGTDLFRFLKWWDESGQSKTISAPEDQDAINVMTIHKSKGLGFKSVIIPFFKEKLDHTGGRLWCNIEQQQEEDKISFDAPVPVVYTSALSETVFSKDYDREKLYTFVDNLNTAYVAFTRPKDELIIYSQAPKIKKDATYSLASVADILYLYYETVPQGGEVEIFNDENSGMSIKRVSVGEQTKSVVQPEMANKIVFSNVFSEPFDDSRTRTSLNTGSVNEETSIREYGIAMHYVFSLINVPQDVPGAVARAFTEGVCECPEAELTGMVLERLKSVEEYGWFSGDYTVLNECDIIKPDGNVVRPDRVLIKNGCAVVVDYKFGEQRKYIRQMREYMDLLSRMGYKEVKGYIWYVASGMVEECLFDE